MIQLLKHEWKRWLKKRNLLVVFCLIIGCCIFYQVYYVNPYHEFSKQEVKRLDEEVLSAMSNKKILEQQVEALQEEGAEAEDKEFIKLNLDIWKIEYNDVYSLRNLWANNDDGKYDEEITRIQAHSDQNLLRFEENNIPLTDTSIYNKTHQDILDRIQLREAYETAGIKQNVIPNMPNANYVLYQLLSGSDVTIIMLILLLFVINFSCWTSEFEYDTYKLCFTQPYTRIQIYFSKLLVQLLVNVLLVLGYALLLYVNGFVFFGEVEPQLVKTVVEGVSQFTATTNFFLPFACKLLYYFSILLVMIHAISLYSKRSEISLLFSITLFLVIIFSSFNEAVTILNYYQNAKAVALGSSSLTMSLMLLLIGMIIIASNIAYLRKCDLKQ